MGERLENEVEVRRGRGHSMTKERNQLEFVKKRVATWEKKLEDGRFGNPDVAGSRRLMADEDAPSAWFLFAPILMILMLVVMLWRKPARALFTSNETRGYGRDNQQIEPSSEYLS